jgi:penicillin-binding protein 1A
MLQSDGRGDDDGHVRVVAWALTVAVAVLAGACSYTPATLDVTDPALAQSTKVYAADGTLLTTLVAEENRENVRIADLPAHVIDAVLAAEDSRFYDHRGVDVRAILRAVAANTRSGEIVEGGSTITQQYVKNTMLTPDQSLDRKVEEALLAMQLERAYSKDRILELYLNTIYFGNGAYGIEAAAAEYFGVRADGLSVAQAATLAGIIRAPSAYDPYDEPEAAVRRRDTALLRMGDLGWLEPDEVAAARAEPMELAVKATEDRYEAPLFVEQAKALVLRDPRFGETFGERRDLLFNGGLRITTTVDLRLQAIAEESVARVRPPEPGPEAALVSVDPATGMVRAIVGGRDFFGGGGEAKVDLATGGRGRPAGSSFKPLVLAAALEEGVQLDRRYPAPDAIDIPVTGDVWHVDNYEGGGGLGEADLVQATVTSSNTVYAQLISDVGPSDAMAAAERYGVASPLHAYPSAVLGTNDVTGLDMATAYATFANRGLRVDPTFVTKVTKADGTVLHQHEHTSTRVLDAGVADQVNGVLQQVVEQGTGVNARIGRPVAGKTGTGQEWRDAWFVGYTPDLVTSVWMGFAKEGNRSMVPPATPMQVTGGTWPAQIWQLYTSAALADVPVTPFVPPPDPVDPTAEQPVDPLSLPRVRTVVGLPVEPAAASLTRDGYVVERLDVPSDEYPPGYVVAQRPRAEARLASGRTVTIEVANGQAASSAVPSVLGLAQADAVEALRRAGFATDVVPEAEPPAAGVEGRAGQVWKQSPAGGARRVPGTSVRISVNPAPPAPPPTAPPATAPPATGPPPTAPPPTAPVAVAPPPTAPAGAAPAQATASTPATAPPPVTALE